MAGQNADMQVRLSAAGVDEVVRALQRVQNQAQQTGKAAGKGMGLLNDALGDLKGLLPQLGVAAAVGGLVVMTKRALESADAIGKLSQKSGIGTQTLSALKLAGDLADASFEQLSKGLLKFNKFMGELDEGSSSAAAAVRRLFGDSGALNGLNAEQRLIKVGEAIGKLPAGFNKTKAAMDFFGKSGADLIPMLDDLAANGMEQFLKKARELGVVVDEELARSAQIANDNLKELQIAAEGAATQFASGLAPALADSAKALTEAVTGEGVNGLREVGKVVGDIAKSIVGGFIVAGDTVAYVINNISERIDEAKEKAKAFVEFAENFRPGNMINAWRAADAEDARITEKFKKRREKLKESYGEQMWAKWDALWNPAGGAAKGGKDGKGGAGGGSAPTPNADKATMDLLRARLDQEFAMASKYLDLDQQRNQRAYEAGKISLARYFDERKAIVLTASANEIATLEQQRKMLQGSSLGVTEQDSDDQIQAKKIKRRQDLEAIDAKIAQAQLDRTAKLEVLNEDQRQKEEAFGRQRLELEAQLAQLQGDTYQSALSSIQAQVEVWRKAGYSPSLIYNLMKAMKAQAGGAQLQKSIGQSETQLGTVQANLQNQVAAGQIYPFEAALQYKAAVDALIPSLIAELQVRRELTTTTDEEKIQIDQQIAGLNATQIAAGNAAQGYGSLKQASEQAVTSDLTNFLTSGIDEAESFGDAMRGLALSVVDSLRQIAAQMLATLATQQLLKAVGGMFGFSGGGLVAAADGGYISGPGSGTSDSIPARLSNGEFVVRSAVVAQPGVLPLLASLNNGMGKPSLRTRGGVQGFADGGLVTAQDAMSQGLSVDARFETDEGVITRRALVALKSKDGQRAIIENLGKNQKATGRALGR